MTTYTFSGSGTLTRNIVRAATLTGVITININGYDSIGDNAFDSPMTSVKTIRTIILDSNVRSIGISAFSNQSELVEIILPMVTSIGSRAFWSCTWLEEITIPKTVAQIGTNAFLFSGLYTVYLPINNNLASGRLAKILGIAVINLS